MDVIKHLRELQTEYGLTDYKIAKAAGLSSGTVSNILKRNTYPRIDTLENICKAFGLTLSQFFAEGELVELTPELRELIENWVKLSDEKKTAILQLIKASI